MMRKAFCILTLTLFAVSFASAQLKKGNRMMGASIGTLFYNSSKADFTFPSVSGYTSESTNLGVSLNPSYGWFISDNTVVGALVSVSVNSNKQLGKSGGITFQKDQVTTFNLGLGGFVRHYLNSGGAMKPFGQFNLNLGPGSTNGEGFVYGEDISGPYRDNYERKSSGDFFYNVGAVVGVTKFITEHTGLDLYLGYTYSYNKSASKTTTIRDYETGPDITYEYEPTVKSTNHGFVLGVGFQIFLSRK